MTDQRDEKICELSCELRQVRDALAKMLAKLAAAESRIASLLAADEACSEATVDAQDEHERVVSELRAKLQAAEAERESYLATVGVGPSHRSAETWPWSRIRDDAKHRCSELLRLRVDNAALNDANETLGKYVSKLEAQLSTPQADGGREGAEERKYGLGGGLYADEAPEPGLTLAQILDHSKRYSSWGVEIVVEVATHLRETLAELAQHRALTKVGLNANAAAVSLAVDANRELAGARAELARVRAESENADKRWHHHVETWIARHEKAEAESAALREGIEAHANRIASCMGEHFAKSLRALLTPAPGQAEKVGGVAND